MKKTFSIFFLALFLFNVGGYYMVFWALHMHADRRLTQVVNSGLYSEEETWVVKIPLSLPYPLPPRGSQRTEGEVEIDGAYYKLVEQKLQDDTLHIVMIRNVHKENLIETMTDYASLSNDLPATAQNAFNMSGKLLKDYTASSGIALSEITGWHSTTISYFNPTYNLLAGSRQTTSPPPRS